jgi:hypothetical protein
MFWGRFKPVKSALVERKWKTSRPPVRLEQPHPDGKRWEKGAACGSFQYGNIAIGSLLWFHQLERRYESTLWKIGLSIPKKASPGSFVG